MAKTNAKPKLARKTPAAARAKKSPAPAKKSPAPAKKPAKQSRPPRAKTAKASQAGAPAKARAGTKQATLIDHLQRKEGATLADLVKATGWQAHSVRGAISGTLKKKLGYAVATEAVEGRGRVYRIVAGD